MEAVRRRKQVRRTGFSLLELLIVLAIMGVIASIVAPQLLGRQRDASIRVTRTSIQNLEVAVRFYRAQHDQEFPEGGEEVFDMLLAPTSANGIQQRPYIDQIPTDAWGAALRYQYPPSHQASADCPDVWSPGPNGTDENGDGDDINNWDEPEDA